MTRWTDKTESELAALSAKNRAARTADPRTEALAKAMLDPRFADSILVSNHLLRKSSKPRSKVPTESQEQQAVIQWWDRYAATKGIDPRLLFAVPNGSNKSMASAAKFKREGLRAGVPDLMLAIGRTILMRNWLGLFIEMKRTKGGKLSPDQEGICKLLHDQGYLVVVCKGAVAAINVIRDYVA